MLEHVLWENITKKINTQTYLVYMPYYNIKTLSVEPVEVVGDGTDINNRMLQYNYGGKTTFHNTPHIPIYEPADEHETVLSRVTIPQMAEMMDNRISFTLRLSYEIRDIKETIEKYLNQFNNVPIRDQEIGLFIQRLNKLYLVIDNTVRVYDKKENKSTKHNFTDIIKLFIR